MKFFIKKYHILLLLLVLLTSSIYAFQTDNSSLDEPIEQESFDEKEWEEITSEFDYFEETEDVLQIDNPYLTEPVEQRNFDEKKWKKITSELDYSEDIGEALKKRKGTERKPAEQPPPPWNGPSEGVLTFLKFLLILGGIVAIAVVLGYMIGAFKDSPKNKKISNTSVKTLDLEQVEDNIYETDLEQLIRQAVGEGQYSIAIRLYYLLVIKELSLKEHIIWKRDKTNMGYLKELEQTSFFVPFRQVTSVYEKAWYGDVQPKEGDYEAVKGDFEDLVRQIRV